MLPRSRNLALVLIALIIAGLLALFQFRPDSDRVFSVRGVIRAPHADGEISIQHEAIPDYMPAMTMPFRADETEVRDLSPGDRVEFEFRVGAESSRATKFRKLGRVEAGEDSRGSPASAMGKRLRAGDAVPAFALVNQQGRPITEAEFRGRQTVVTFIFTRCPVPEFCPLLGRKFKTLQDGLAETGNEARLLSITIDPEHDQPEVLREYGKSLGADFDRWSFATGTPGQIEQLTRLFAVRAERNGAALDHTLATALIGPEGNVLEIWRGNVWKPEEILARVGAGR